MGQKPQYDAIFSLFFKKITTALMPIFCKKTSILLETYSSHAHILSDKRPSPQKHGASRHLHQFFHEKTPAVMPMFGQNSSILPKLHYIMGYKSQ